MSTFTVEIQVPNSLRDLGYTEDEIRRDVPVLLVLKRFKSGLISSGKAANVLGMSRRDFLELLGREGIPIYEPGEDGFLEELKTVQRQ